MKRILALLLTLTMVFALCACGGSKTEAPASEPVPASESKPVSEMKPEPTETPETPAHAEEEAQIAVEDFEIKGVEEDGCFRFTVKIRNITDRDLEKIVFDYQVLDQNGDILLDQSCGASNVAAGQAIWAGPYRIKDGAHSDEFAAICFVSPPSWHKSRTPLKEKVTFQLADYMN